MPDTGQTTSRWNPSGEVDQVMSADPAVAGTGSVPPSDDSDQQPNPATGEGCCGPSDDGVYDQLAELGKALSNPIRIRLLDILEQGEHTVDELAEAAGQPVKNTSAQLKQLRACQLVTTRRAGTYVHYRLAGAHVSHFLGGFESFAEETLAGLRVHLDEIDQLPGAAQRLTVDECAAWMQRGDAVVVDVRSTDEFARGHLPGSVSMPSGELADRAGELPADTALIVYCDGPYCLASARAVAWLERAGWSVRHLAGGITQWTRSGRELST